MRWTNLIIGFIGAVIGTWLTHRQGDSLVAEAVLILLSTGASYVLLTLVDRWVERRHPVEWRPRWSPEEEAEVERRVEELRRRNEP